MIHALKFFIFQHRFLILIMTACAGVTAAGWVDAGWLLVPMSWLLLYRMNVEEKNKKTWSFFQSLPLSLPEKTVVKVLVPFSFVMALYLLREGVPAAYEIVGETGSLAALSAAALVLMSLSTNSAGKFVIGYFGLWLLTRPLTFSAPLMFVSAGALLGAGVAYLSGKRLILKRAAFVGLVAALPVALSGHYAEEAALERFLTSGSGAKQVEVALKLYRLDQRESARVVMQVYLQSPENRDLFEDVLDAFDDANQMPSVSEYVWSDMVRYGEKWARLESIRFLTRRVTKNSALDWLNDGFIAKVEPAVVGAGEQKCKGQCQQLARLTARIYQKSLSTQTLERLRNHVKSEAGAHYVLRVMNVFYIKELESDLKELRLSASEPLQVEIDRALKRNGDFRLDLKVEEKEGKIAGVKRSDSGDVEIRISRRLKEKIEDAMGHTVEEMEDMANE